MRHSLGLLSLFVGCLFLQDLNRGGPAAGPANAKTDAASTGHVYTPPKADTPSIAAASDQGERQIASFKIPDGLKVKLWAAEPMLANPVCISVDEHGRIYRRRNVSHPSRRRGRSWAHGLARRRHGLDRPWPTGWRLLKKHLGKEHRRIHQARGPHSCCWKIARAAARPIIVEHFRRRLQRIAARHRCRNALARHGDVYYTYIPDLWRLRDTQGTGHADVRQSLSYGYGVPRVVPRATICMA